MFEHTCRKCKHLSLTRKQQGKEWTCLITEKNKAFDQTIFDNLCSSFEKKNER